MKSLPKLMRSFWFVALLALFGLCSTTSTPGMAVPPIAYDEGALPTIAYDVPSLSVFDYDIAPALPANERERRGAETSGVLAGFSSFLAAESEANIVYRALNAKDAERLGAGLGLEARAPTGEWSLGEHIANGSKRSAWANDPWIATTKRLDVAQAFEGGNGIIAIDLNKVRSLQQQAWQIYPRVNGADGLPYHYSFWQQEVSILQSVPREAIIGPVK